MRTYYIFFIKNDIYNLTKNNTESLYKIFESIKYLKKEDATLGFKVYQKICDKVPKKIINKLIKDDFIDNLSYNIFKDIHIINDFINNEITKLIIHNSYIIIKSSCIYPEFFKSLYKFQNIFVCDFENIDYFYLKNLNIKTLTI